MYIKHSTKTPVELSDDLIKKVTDNHNRLVAERNEREEAEQRQAQLNIQMAAMFVCVFQ